MPRKKKRTHRQIGECSRAAAGRRRDRPRLQEQGKLGLREGGGGQKRELQQRQKQQQQWDQEQPQQQQHHHHQQRAWR